MYDFTLKSYASIIEAGLLAGYEFRTVGQHLQAPDMPNAIHHIVVRHDVDRRPGNALAMARLEAESGIASTYYFRVIGSAFDTGIIAQIAELGHEIGYHYEDFHTANYDEDIAIQMFESNLRKLREIAPIKTIAMHGSPFSKFNNMKIWEYHSFEDHHVMDCILSFDWKEYAFFTDTGRTFGESSSNLRDRIGSNLSYGDVRTSADLAAFLGQRRHDKIQLSTHPERWDEHLYPWLLQAAKDHAANAVKRGVKLLGYHGK
jgi:hypothetical protein